MPLIRPLSARSLMESVGARGGVAVAAAADAGVFAEAAGELVDSRRAASTPRQPKAARESTAKTLWDANMSVFERDLGVRSGTDDPLKMYVDNGRRCSNQPCGTSIVRTGFVVR